MLFSNRTLTSILLGGVSMALVAGCGSSSSTIASDVRTVNLSLTTEAEVPPVVPATIGNQTGSATVSLDVTNSVVTITGSFSGLSSPALVIGPSVMHAHVIEEVEGSIFQSTGPVSFGIDVTLATDGRSGTFSTVESLSNLQVQQFLDGLYYLNLHTELNMPGELRSQVVF